ncbi:hypothetical protein V6Z11_D01G048200 [Gossypium hirsutum]
MFFWAFFCTNFRNRNKGCCLLRFFFRIIYLFYLSNFFLKNLILKLVIKETIRKEKRNVPDSPRGSVDGSPFAVVGIGLKRGRVFFFIFLCFFGFFISRNGLREEKWPKWPFSDGIRQPHSAVNGAGARWLRWSHGGAL